MFTRSILALCAFMALYTHAQNVGGTGNSQQIPQNVTAGQLSGGGFSGDVNVFNGSFSASYPLGSVSTPGGISYQLSLNYSPSYSVGQTPSVCSGIPYGEGWNVGIPMITASNSAYFSFLESYECHKRSEFIKDSSNYFNDSLITIGGVEHVAGTKNGDVYWFSPHVSVPGVASGRAIFKYIDQNDASCAVFILNKFESYIELRFYGDRWRLSDSNGGEYEFRTTLVTYRAPSNTRTLNYNLYNHAVDNEVSDINEANGYGASVNGEEVLNAIEPKQAYTSWYCNVITNRNIPNQSIQFEYEKFGKFNYFQEFEQTLLKNQVDAKLRDPLTLGPDGYDYLNYDAYTDVLLTRLTSYTVDSKFEVLDLGYATSDLIGSYMLDPDDAGVERLDSLYAYETVFSDGIGEDNFNGWNRYYHGKSDGAHLLAGSGVNEPSISPSNPYLTTANNGTTSQGYLRGAAPSGDDISFDHAFLESPRILDDGTSLIPGDIYEVRTRISDNNGADSAMGTGTIDIAVVTGDLGFDLGGYYSNDKDTTEGAICDSTGIEAAHTSGSYSTLNTISTGNVLTTSKYEKTRGTPVFTTQNQAIKWQIPEGQTSITTSNFFSMPNVPSNYGGVNLQIGPGNSDTYYAESDMEFTIEVNEDGVDHPSAYMAYAHAQSTTGGIAPYDPLPQNFGIGMPWSMVAPLYIEEMGGMDDEYARNADGYEFWWNIPSPPATSDWENQPTKFNDEVRLEEVEIIRYSKTPYMLSHVNYYRVNGEVDPNNDTSGMVLIAQNELEYAYEAKRFFENYPYRIQGDVERDTTNFPCYDAEMVAADTLIHSTTYTQYVYTLNTVKNIPVAGWKNDPSVADTHPDSTVLQTEFEYEWYGYEDDQIILFQEEGFPGRRTRVMTKYTDHLGGETHVEYYPRETKSTLKEGKFSPRKGCAQYNARPIFNQSFAYEIHPAVHYLTRLDEKNNTETSSPGAPLKRYEYVYDTAQIIYQSFDYNLPANFRGGYKKNYSKGFAKTTVYQPELESGEQNYTVYYHHGNVYEPTLIDSVTLLPDPSTTEEYLFFGKLDSVIQYNSLGQKEEETFFEYSYTKAFENGMKRKRTLRDNLLGPLDYDNVTNYVHSREYEYADYYKNESDSYSGWVGYKIVADDGNPSTSTTWTIGDTTVNENDQILFYTNFAGELDSIGIAGYTAIDEKFWTRKMLSGTINGTDAKTVVTSGSFVGTNWGGPREKAAFLESAFYADLELINPEPYLHSYFIKMEKKTQRSYDDFRYSSGTGGTVIISDSAVVDPSPFGPPYTNPIVSASGDASKISAINSSPDGTSVESMLISSSPLSENVLYAFTNKIGTFQSKVIKNVLIAQSNLSDGILSAVYNGSNSLQTTHVQQIFNDQSYISDEFLHSIVGSAGQKPDALIEYIYAHNDYLSDTVMIRMCETGSFSQNALKTVFLTQGQLSEPVLVALATETNGNASFAVEAIVNNQSVVSDTVFYELAENSTIGDNKILSMYTNSQTDPSDHALISLLNRTPQIDQQLLVNVLQGAQHYFGDSLRTKITITLTEENADQGIEYQENYNPYGIHCEEDILVGRDYLETITEYTYYEANYDGTTLSEGYKKLMGLEDVEGKVVPDALSDLGEDLTLSAIELKHLPSWQLFSTKTYSSDYPDAYSETEMYYYYDLLNRVSRHFQYYDLESGDYFFDVDDTYYEDTLFFSNAWPSEHLISGDYPGHYPLHDGARNAQRNNLRGIPFQQTVFSKNNQAGESIMQSEYFIYDSRWNRAVYKNYVTESFSGPICGDTTYYEQDCDECFTIKWAGDDAEIMEQVPWGFCAYEITGTIIKCCPYTTDPSACGYTSIEKIGCNPVSEDPALDTIGTKIIAPELAMDKAMYLRNVVVQIDSVSSTIPQWDDRTDASNDYILDFYVTNLLDSLNRRIAHPNYPFDTLTIRTVDERNQYTQVQLEHNQSGIYTRYDYDTTTRVWHDNINAGPGCTNFGDYSTIINTNVGMPKSVTVGDGRADAMRTEYAYYPNYSLDSLVDANGHRLHYVYDDYDRLEKTYENGRLLSENSYYYWRHDTARSFQERTEQNYVETNLYRSADTLSREHVRAYIDPLGRNYSTISSIDDDSTQIHSGTVTYDNWGRTLRAYKPYKLTDQTFMQPSADTTLAYAHSLYENTPKSRTLRTAKYGITDITGVHTVKQEVELIDEIILSCELGLVAPEAALLIDPEFDEGLKFVRVETKDEDEKEMITYSNAIGQQIATKQYGESLENPLITLFIYDDYGNVTQVINPEKQKTNYTYNILGQLIQETNVDAGTTNYMYNRQGLLSISQDANGCAGEIPPGETEAQPFFRVYEYDAYGRLKKQKRSYYTEPTSLPARNNPEITPFFYADASDGLDVDGNPIFNDETSVQDYYEYFFSNRSSYDWLAKINYVVHGGGVAGFSAVEGLATNFINLSGGRVEKEYEYGVDTTYNRLGKLRTTYSHNADGDVIEQVDYRYNEEGQVTEQIIWFSAVSDFTDTANYVKIRMKMEEYNYRGALQRTTIDVYDDDTLDMQYTQKYDDWNRLREVWVSFKAGEDGNRVVSYNYNDALGLLTETKHYVNADCGEQEAQTITHSYDVRDRLKSITSDLFSYYLYYDDQEPTHTDFSTSVNYDQNWNGNINGTVADYTFGGLNVTNGSSTNDLFDQATVYGYQYDLVNRLVAADALAGDEVDALNMNTYGIGDVTYNFDRIGNLTNIKRGLEIEDGGTDLVNEEWNYKYTAGTNQLFKVQGVGTTTNRNYTYDANGNLATDDFRKLTTIDYARANYPYHISKDSAEIDYLYGVDDQRMYKRTQTSIDTTEEYYLGGLGILNMRNDEWTWYVSGADRVAKISPTAEQQPAYLSTYGTAADINDDLEASFYLYDHLGNTRVVYQPSIQCPAYVQVQLEFVADYYPYGKVLRDFYVEASNPEKFLTTQHERDLETGLDYRGARFYDSDVARFLSLDPHASNYPSLSDYSYVAGNPLKFVDRDGKDIIPTDAFLKSDFLSALISLEDNDAFNTYIDQFFDESGAFNLTLHVDNEKVPEGKLAITVYTYNYATDEQGEKFSTSVEATIYFRSDLNTLNELGRITLLVHEYFHAYSGLKAEGDGSADTDHTNWDNYIKEMIEVVSEYSDDNNLGYSETQIYELSIFNVGSGGKIYDDYINKLAEENGTVYEWEKARYEERMKALMYDE